MWIFFCLSIDRTLAVCYPLIRQLSKCYAKRTAVMSEEQEQCGHESQEIIWWK